MLNWRHKFQDRGVILNGLRVKNNRGSIRDTRSKTSIRKSLTPYLCFVKENRQRVAQENPGVSSKDMMTAMG